MLAVDLADGRGVRAPDVVLLDVEVRHRVGVRPVAQHEIAVRLEGVGALGAASHPDEPRVHRTRRAADGALEHEVARRPGRSVLLERPEVVHLGPVAEVRGQQLGAAALSGQDRLGAETGVLATERGREGAERRIPPGAYPLMSELPGAGAELLDGVVGQDRGVPDGDVDDRARPEAAPSPETKSSITVASAASPSSITVRGKAAWASSAGRARAEQVHDHDRVLDARPSRDREHERVPEEGVGEMVEGVRLVLLLAALARSALLT